MIETGIVKSGLAEDCVTFCDDFAPDWFLAVMIERLECVCKRGLGKVKREGNNIVTIYRNCRKNHLCSSQHFTPLGSDKPFAFRSMFSLPRNQMSWLLEAFPLCFS